MMDRADRKASTAVGLATIFTDPASPNSTQWKPVTMTSTCSLQKLVLLVGDELIRTSLQCYNKAKWDLRQRWVQLCFVENHMDSIVFIHKICTKSAWTWIGIGKHFESYTMSETNRYTFLCIWRRPTWNWHQNIRINAAQSHFMLGVNLVPEERIFHLIYAFNICNIKRVSEYHSYLYFRIWVIYRYFPSHRHLM